MKNKIGIACVALIFTMLFYGCAVDSESSVSVVTTESTTMAETTTKKVNVDLKHIYNDSGLAEISSPYGLYANCTTNGDRISISTDSSWLPFMLSSDLQGLKKPLEEVGVDNFDVLVNKMEMSTPDDGTQTEEYDNLYIMWNVTEEYDPYFGGLNGCEYEIQITIFKK